MGYSESDSDVRMSLFKPSGKWSRDAAVNMGGVYHEPLIHDAVAKAWLAAHDGMPPAEGWTIVCLEPYHKHAHPVMLKDNDRWERLAKENAQ